MHKLIYDVGLKIRKVGLDRSELCSFEDTISPLKLTTLLKLLETSLGLVKDKCEECDDILSVRRKKKE